MNDIEKKIVDAIKRCLAVAEVDLDTVLDMSLSDCIELAAVLERSEIYLGYTQLQKCQTARDIIMLAM